jgi:hypothetical protein
VRFSIKQVSAAISEPVPLANVPLAALPSLQDPLMPTVFGLRFNMLMLLQNPINPFGDHVEKVRPQFLSLRQHFRTSAFSMGGTAANPQ